MTCVSTLALELMIGVSTDGTYAQYSRLVSVVYSKGVGQLVGAVKVTSTSHVWVESP